MFQNQNLDLKKNQNNLINFFSDTLEIAEK